MSLSRVLDAPATVAIVSSSPALGSILAGVLEGHRGWRVRQFTTLSDLSTYMRIAPVAVIVADFHFPEGTLAGFAEAVRHGAQGAGPSPAILALVKTVDPQLQRVCLSAGIDEVIVKPMSPAHIEERVQVHMARDRKVFARGEGYRGPERRGRLSLSEKQAPDVERRGDNVVSFAAHRAARQAPPATA